MIAIISVIAWVWNYCCWYKHRFVCCCDCWDFISSHHSRSSWGIVSRCCDISSESLKSCVDYTWSVWAYSSNPLIEISPPVLESEQFHWWFSCCFSSSHSLCVCWSCCCCCTVSIYESSSHHCLRVRISILHHIQSIDILSLIESNDIISSISRVSVVCSRIWDKCCLSHISCRSFSAPWFQHIWVVIS